MHHAIKSGIASIFFIFCLCAQAQDFELIKFQSAYYPSRTIEESNGGREVGFWEWSGQLAIPQPLKNKQTIFIHQLRYSHLSAEMTGLFPNGDSEATKSYHTISYGLSWVQVFNPKWQLATTVVPTIASDLSGSLKNEDFLFLANAMAIHTKNDRLKYGLGLAYTTRFGRQLLVPMGMMKYQWPNMTLDILLPNKLSLLFNTSNSFQYGFQARLEGGLFSNSSEIQIVNDEINAAGYSRLNIGPMVSIQLKKVINLNLEGGMAIGRRLDFIENGGETQDRTPESGPFVKVGLSLRPPTKMTTKGNGG